MALKAEVENILAISFFATVSLSDHHFFFKGGGSERVVEEREGRETPGREREVDIS